MNLSAAEASGIEVPKYLQSRASNSSFTMVEFGYGHCPVVKLQPHEFQGDQVYIGIEAGMRTKSAADIAIAMRQLHAHKNAFFMVHDIGQGEVYRPDLRSDDEEYKGDYKAETVLPGNIADEVFASNVFCDPLIARSWLRTTNLLAEMSRVMASSGVAVLRETITPWEVDAIGPYSLERAGLTMLDRITPEQQAWGDLEQVYGSEYRSPAFPESYYLFLGKAGM